MKKNTKEKIIEVLEVGKYTKEWCKAQAEGFGYRENKRK